MCFKVSRVSVLGFEGKNLHQIAKTGVSYDAIFRSIGWDQKYVDTIDEISILAAISKELTWFLDGKSCVFLDMINERWDKLSWVAAKTAKTMEEIADADNLTRPGSEVKEYAQLKRKDITSNEAISALLRYYHLTQGSFEKYRPLLLEYKKDGKETLEELKKRTILEYKKRYCEILKLVTHDSVAEHLAAQGLLQCSNVTFRDLELVSRGTYTDLIWDLIHKKKSELELERDKRVEICLKMTLGSKNEKEAVLNLLELY